MAAGIVAAAMGSYLIALTVLAAPANFAIAQLGLIAVACAMAAPAQPAPRIWNTLGALGLRRARARDFAAAIAIGATAWYGNAWLVDWIASHWELPQVEIRHLQGLVERPPLLQGLAMFALLPAVCEEVVFRGVLARSLGRHHGLLVGVGISAVVFAGYHLSVVQALPTLTLGAMLGLIAIRADSIAPTIAAHAINNAMAIAMSRGELAGITAWMTEHPDASLAGCAAAIAAGIAIAMSGRRAAPAELRAPAEATIKRDTHHE
jgi:sodium transport system permease protein